MRSADERARRRKRLLRQVTGCLVREGADRSNSIWCDCLPQENCAKSKRRAADRVRRRLIQERDESTGPSSPDNSPMTFRAFAELHLDGEARSEIREVTRRGYIHVLNSFAFPVFGDLPLETIKSRDISAFLVELRKTHSASQLNHLRAALSRVFQAALTHQLVIDNPVRRTKPLRAHEGDKTLSQLPWTLQECSQAMEIAVGTEMDAFIHVLVLTGVRLGECLGLKWSDIDFTARTIRISRTLVELRSSRYEGGGKGQPTFGPPKTLKSIRTLNFGQNLLEALLRHKEVQDALREGSGDDWQETGCLFTTSGGKPVWPSNFTSKYRKFLKDRDRARGVD